MNDVAYVEAARKLAERILREADAVTEDRLRRSYELVLGRAPKPRETVALRTALAKFDAYYRQHPKDAEAFVSEGKSPRNRKIPVPELAAWTAIASLVLNTDEAITRE
jgi:hypothetical protein